MQKDKYLKEYCMKKDLYFGLKTKKEIREMENMVLQTLGYSVYCLGSEIENLKNEVIKEIKKIRPFYLLQ